MDGLIEPKPTPGALRGARVSFVGRLASMTRAEAHAAVERAGGTATTSVSGRTTHVVIGMHGWPLRADGSVSMKLQEAERLRARHGRPAIVSETRFLELLEGPTPPPDVRKTYALDQVAGLVGVDERTITRWEYLGLVSSEDGAYDFQDIISLQAIASLVQRGVEPRLIRESLAQLSTFLPGTERPLAQLHVVASDEGELAAQVGDTLVTPDGQQLMDFRPAGETPEPVPAETTPHSSADELLERALWLEEEERYEEAAAAYRRAIAVAPGRSELYFNLGNVLRTAGRAEAAEELYRLAVVLEPSNELGWYNLADLQEEAGEHGAAAESLLRAVEANPAFADGHFNLAGCLEHLGRRAEATRHWRAYLELDPHSEWARIARGQLGQLPALP